MTDPRTSETRAECSYKVSFAGVGRGKKSWVSILHQTPSESILERLVRESGAVMSQDIECVFDEDMEYGTVIVGGFRTVGSFRVEMQHVK